MRSNRIKPNWKRIDPRDKEDLIALGCVVIFALVVFFMLNGHAHPAPQPTPAQITGH